MALTSLPVIGTGQTLGPTKSDARAATDTTRQLAASEWNAAAVALAEVCASVGLATGPAAGSIEAERLRNASEIGAALTDSDHVLVSDASDTTDHATGTVKKSLLSRLSTYIQSAIPIAFGTWTPTGTGVTNVDSVTPQASIYVQIGSIVVFAANVSIDCTAAAFTEFRLSLPVTSNFAAETDAAGTVTGSSAGNYSAGRCYADTTNDALLVAGTSASAAAQTKLMIAGIYRVL